MSLVKDFQYFCRIVKYSVRFVKSICLQQ